MILVVCNGYENEGEYIFFYHIIFSFFFPTLIAKTVTSMVTLAARVHDVGEIEFTSPLAHSGPLLVLGPLGPGFIAYDLD